MNVITSILDTGKDLIKQNIANYKQANDLYVGSRDKSLRNYLAKHVKPNAITNNDTQKTITKMPMPTKDIQTTITKMPLPKPTKIQQINPYMDPQEGEGRLHKKQLFKKIKLIKL